MIRIIISLILVLFISCNSKQQVKENSTSKDAESKPNNTQGNGNNSSKTKSVGVKEELNINTSDSKLISANYFYSENKKETSEPLVILIHQFNSSKEEWKQDFIDSLLSAGYKVIAYDIRGHGKSSKPDVEFSQLLTDPGQAPLDITAVFAWAKTQKGIDSSRIAAIGTSVGGNLACYASFNLGAKTCVAISNGKETFEKFIGYDERMMGRVKIPRANSIFFICGSKDGDHEKGQRYMMDTFVGDPKDIKVFDSDKHGRSLIAERPEINTLIINWLNKNL